MAFLGFYTISETVRCYAVFIDLSGAAIVPLSPTITIIQGGSELVSGDAMIQQTIGSNVFYYDYTIPSSPVEGTVEVIYTGTIDGNIVQDSDHFAINKIKTHVLENRLGNQRIIFYPSLVSGGSRNLQIGVLDRQVIETKKDSDADWSSPTSSKTLYFHYEAIGDINPLKVGEA